MGLSWALWHDPPLSSLTLDVIVDRGKRILEELPLQLVHKDLSSHRIDIAIRESSQEPTKKNHCGEGLGLEPQAWGRGTKAP